MIRLIIGSIIGGIVQFMVGAIAWVSPLGKLAFVSLGDAATADVQTALARTLTPTGTGTYFIPSPETAAGTALLGKGPVALIHFNTNGFPPMDAGALLIGLLLSIGMMVLVALAVSGTPTLAGRMRIVTLFAVATSVYFIGAIPVFNIYMPWAWWIFLMSASFLAFVGGAFVMLRWFMPTHAAMPETTLH